MLFLRFLLSAANLSQAWKILKGLYKATRGKLKSVKVSKKVRLPLATWSQRFWAALLGMTMIEEVAEHVIALFSKGWGLGMLAFAKVAPGHASDVVEMAANFITSFEPLATRLAAITMTQITGVPIDPANIQHVGSPAEGRARSVSLGGEFMQVVAQIFDINLARQDFETRTGIAGSAENLASYFGTNLFFQLRSLTISTVASLTGWHTLRHLEALHQSVNWAFGFGWLSWSVMSEYMNVATMPGVRRFLLSTVKPNDYSQAESRYAVWAGTLPREQHDRIMDNEGVRVDIRETLLRRAETDLSESDLALLLRKRRMTESAVTSDFRWKGFGAARTQQKLTIFKEKKLWDLLDDVDDLHLTLYRDLVIGSDAARAWLQGNGWNDDEISAGLAKAELQRQVRKWLPDSDLEKAMKHGLLSASEVTDYVEAQGMTPLDALIHVLIMELDNLPKDCMDKIRPGDISGIINAIFAALLGKGVLTLPPGMLKLAQCLGTFPFPIPGGDDEDDKPPKIQLPTGSFTTNPSSPYVDEEFRLTWNIDHADHVTIDNGIGAVPTQGVKFLVAKVNTVWKLTAENDDGVKTFQASILAKEKAVPKTPKPPAPTVSLSVSPSTVTEGEQYSLVWSTFNVSSVLLDQGEGPRATALNGAQIKVADRNRIFTLTGVGDGGQKTRSDTLIVTPVAADEIAKPTASLAITPGQADEGSRVEVRWTTANANSLNLQGVTVPGPIGPTGAAIVSADHDRIVTLTATNTATGVARSSSDAMIVNRLKEEPDPKAPKPSLTLTLRPSTVLDGEKVAVEWRGSNLETLTIDTGSGPQAQALAGAFAITPAHDQLVVAHGVGKGGEVSVVKYLLVKKEDPKDVTFRKPTVSLAVSPSRAQFGAPVILEWKTSNATAVRLQSEGTLLSTEPVGSLVITATTSQTLRLSASGPGGTDAVQRELLVSPAPPPDKGPLPRIMQWEITPYAPKREELVTVKWFTLDADSVWLLVNGGRVDLEPDGTLETNVNETQIVSLHAKNQAGTTTLERFVEIV